MPQVSPSLKNASPIRANVTAWRLSFDLPSHRRGPLLPPSGKVRNVSSKQASIGSGFGPETTATQAIGDTDLSGKVAVVTGGVQRPRA